MCILSVWFISVKIGSSVCDLSWNPKDQGMRVDRTAPQWWAVGPENPNSKKQSMLAKREFDFMGWTESKDLRESKGYVKVKRGEEAAKIVVSQCKKMQGYESASRKHLRKNCQARLGKLQAFSESKGTPYQLTQELRASTEPKHVAPYLMTGAQWAYNHF